MVELKVRLGPKGQVVIPKIFREHYRIFPNQEVLITEDEEGVLIKKEREDPIKALEKIAKKVNEKKKIKTIPSKKLKEIFYEQYEEKAKRSGILPKN